MTTFEMLILACFAVFMGVVAYGWLSTLGMDPKK